MWKNPNLPEFGCLKGVKVIHSTLSLAGPFCAQMMADNGADVIWLENAKAYDLVRYSPSAGVEVERRNQRNLALDIPSPEGRKVFLKLVKEADVFIECAKGGQYEKWGLSDEVLWEVNPKLVIAHVSGFGQTGLPEYVGRPSYDAIAQAFGGYTFLNTNPVSAPYPVGPYAADYFTGVFGALGIMIALFNAQRTGKGESVDIAQYEIMARVQLNGADALNNNEKMVDISGNPAPTAGWGCLPCKDGVYVQLCLVGGGIVKKTCEFLGVPYGTAAIPEGTSLMRFDTNPEGAHQYQNALLAFLGSKPAAEAEAEMQAAGLPCNKLNRLQDLVDDPHVKARELFVKYKNPKDVEITAVGPVPKFKNQPGQVWRSAPYPGMDNEEVLGELGYTADEIKALYDGKTISKDHDMKLVFGGVK